MPKRTDIPCVCGSFEAAYGSYAMWLPHWAHDCLGVAPWIRAWARRRLDVPPARVIQPEASTPSLL